MWVFGVSQDREVAGVTGALLIKTQTAHVCLTCRKRILVDSSAHFSWDVLGAYYTHRECASPKLISRRPSVVPALPQVVPEAPKKRRLRDPGTLRDWNDKVIG